MSENLRSLIVKYDKLQQSSKQLNPLRKQLIKIIKEEGLSKQKFKFSDHTISYNEYTKPADMSLKIIRDTLAEYYPHMDYISFIEHINATRKENQHTVETLKT